MKLTKQQQTEAMQVYEAYWDSYLKGDVKTLASLLDDDYNQIGSVENEVFFNKRDAVKFVQETIDQVAGKVEMRNRITKVDRVDVFFLISEQCDLYVLIDGAWSFYAKFRASSLLQKKEQGWKFIHQHSSLPDTKAQEGENIAIEKISAENLLLRDAVKRRTVELENKSRELEIEASLERVRAVAMGMKQPDDMVDVCRIISDQLQLLKVKDIRNIQTAIINDAKGIYLNYEYFTQYKTTSTLEIEIKLHPVVIEFVNEIQKSNDAFFTKTF